MKIFTAENKSSFLRHKTFFSNLRTFSVEEKNFNDVCGIVELSCVEDKEVLVNIGNMKVSFDVS
jgi:predicted xylose isomerase-like sugar epimerase